MHFICKIGRNSWKIDEILITTNVDVIKSHFADIPPLRTDFRNTVFVDLDEFLRQQYYT